MRIADHEFHGDRVGRENNDRVGHENNVDHENNVGHENSQVRAATRFAALAAAAGVGFVIIAALWVGTCGGSVDTVACGAPERTMLALGGPLILLIAGLWAFLRTYLVWRDQGSWWGWHGAGWFLLTLMLVALAMGFPPIAGPTIAG